eukprot:TRINITY_DN1084_c0_g1_i1.p1 TRINITY_DN1084_c0_g1~~TRINITY_DN1084_c0_g1_i1.p1  ORF type:complete len:336 (+),score=130.56 TRINITY_DN1084_c0_g1_i1:168-1175(+)
MDRLKELKKKKKQQQKNEDEDTESGVEMQEEKKRKKSTADDDDESKEKDNNNKDNKDEKEEKKTEEDDDIPKHMQQYNPIKEHFKEIVAATGKVEELRELDEKESADEKNQLTLKKLDALMAGTNKHATLAKKALDDIKKQNEAYAKDNAKFPAKVQVRLNSYQVNVRKLHAVMTDYNNAIHAFKQHLRDRVRRRIKIVKDDIKDDQLDKMVENDQVNQNVMKEALEMDTSELQDLVAELEDRHMEILRLEQSITEVYELFRDLATLIDIQQDEFDVIENRIKHAAEFTDVAVEELQKGQEYQLKARKRTCCLLMIVLAVALVIVVPIVAKFGAA